MSLGDRQLVCPCGTPFTFCLEAQRYFDVKGYKDPTHCARCRITLRIERALRKKILDGREKLECRLQYKDKMIRCIMCHKQFCWSIGAQLLVREKGF